MLTSLVNRKSTIVNYNLWQRAWNCQLGGWSPCLEMDLGVLPRVLKELGVGLVGITVMWTSYCSDWIYDLNIRLGSGEYVWWNAKKSPGDVWFHSSFCASPALIAIHVCMHAYLCVCICVDVCVSLPKVVPLAVGSDLNEVKRWIIIFFSLRHGFPV